MAQAVSLHSLPLFVRLAGRPVILLGEGEAADAKRRLLDRAGAHVVTDETSVAALAIVAIDDEAEALAAVATIVLVNAVDRSEHCDFTLPAIVDREPVLIAIGTGGASAGLAAALRQRLEALVPADLGGLASALQRARGAMRTRFPDGGARRRALADALAPGGVLDPLGPSRDVAGWLDRESVQDGAIVRMTLASRDPDDLTLRQARALASADRVYYRSDVPPAILDRARADAARIPCDAPPDAQGSGLVVDVAMRA
jgi:uroporphyrin-III C-methyltransferase/precorrin-2 dehydrogenase/sirohydrochlorin ferrochelatase